MRKQLNYFFRRFLNKRYRLNGQVRGFTLLELLIASVIGVLIVGTMMTFVFSVADTDRQEQAKSTSQEEIQAALDYIADDMREAVYIYDADGLNPLASNPSGIGNSLPVVTNGVPVLVFWKRYIYKSTDTVVTLDGSRAVSCVPYSLTIAPLGTPSANCFGGDLFSYSIVAYYLVKNNATPSATQPWSNAARIVRFELKDGISTSSSAYACSVNCPTTQVVNGTIYYKVPDTGFARFSLGAGVLSAQMNGWATVPPGWDAGSGVTLVDFIDDTTFGATPYTPPVLIGNNTVVVGAPSTNVDCNSDNGVGSNTTTSQRVPGTFTATSLTSFYVCVNSGSSTARIYMRGNALVRLNDNRSIKFPTANNTPFLPTANVRVFGRGVLIPG
ncbi:hypothetical protein TUMEXPCC7403_06545 [Tumidithrix helvetica PCC 7403]|uniref:hormogonium polysaccharide secretion pseudopilin HpsC n=1 Tax=Tumidithrix helvetica TaxID=3457545 RepID=UPI003C7FC02C